MLYWATATWWIPMLVILGFWRHVYKKLALTYTPLYWGAVFPLGMYADSTRSLFDVLNVFALAWIQRIFVYVGLVAWLATFLGLVRTVGNSARFKAGQKRSKGEPV